MMSHGAEDHSHTDDSPGPMMDADIMFLQMMIPHHQQAIEMSSLASTNDASPDVQRLAEAIAAAASAAAACRAASAAAACRAASAAAASLASSDASVVVADRAVVI
jgi:uncharacterized protein (DUF305 family)